MTKPNVYFRADGNSKIGLGHVSRLLAIADMIKDEFAVHFLIANPDNNVPELIKSCCQSIMTLNVDTAAQEAETIASKILKPGDILVLDGYGFDKEYQLTLIQGGLKLVVIDDWHREKIMSEVVINHAEGVDITNYEVEDGALILIGAPYAMLKNEYLALAQSSFNKADKNAVFVCLGGADVNNDVLKVIRQLEAIKKYDEIHIVTGSAYRFGEELQKEIEIAQSNIYWYSNLNVQEMIDVMKRCNYAITSPSTIAYEYLCRKGELYVMKTADNQQLLLNGLINAGVAINFSEFPKENIDHGSLIENQTALFDGLQSTRFKRVFRALNLDARNASLEDSKLLFQWANDPTTRSQSYNSEPIQFEDHVKWYSSKIADPDCDMFIFEINGEPVGQIRYQLVENEFVLGYSVDAEHRGKGLGTSILMRGSMTLKKERGNDITIVGNVKHENVASVHAFRNAGYEEEKSLEYDSSFKFVLR